MVQRYAGGFSAPGVFTAVRTTDVDSAVGLIRRIAEHRAQLTVLDRTAAGFDVRTATFGDHGSDLVRIDGIRYRGTAPPSPVLMGGVMLRGRGLFRGRDVEVRLAAGDGYLGPVNLAHEAEYDNPAFAVVRLTVPYVATIAEQLTGFPAAQFRFESHVPLSPALAGRWTRTVRYVTAELDGHRPDPPPDLLVAELLRLTATTALAAFANTATSASHLPTGGSAVPASVRRAAAYLDAHAAEPVTAAEIAASAGIGLRALQDGFRRHLGTTPSAYLRRVRLERAHRDLQAADPTSGATVGAIVRRWGFVSHSQFTVRYREVFGRPPSHTLRS